MSPRLFLSALSLAFVASVASVVSGARSEGADSCGYASCQAPVPRRVNLHIVPHTHDDVGWLRTVDQYYYYNVQFILDNVIRELSSDPRRRFTYVEVAYFYRWWREQTDPVRDQVRSLVANGQLQFAQGGWCMNDEATTHYADIIDQQTLGMRFLNDTFGDCGRPRVGWQIDPFGHSKEHAALLALMGLDAFYFARIHFLDEIDRALKRRMQFVWRASQDIGSPTTDIFAGDFLAGYCYPSGTNYEGGDQPVQDDPRLHDYNVEEAVRKLIVQVDLLRLTHRTSHLMLTMGCDFAYQNARKNFKILDKLIAAVNSNSSRHNLTAYYSTPTCYTKAVNNEGLEYTTKTDDFFPYASGPNSYWTGFYTSRPALKRLVRRASGHMQAVKQLTAAVPAPPPPTNVTGGGWQRQRHELQQLDQLDLLRQALAVAQHHDAVAGTEKQAVAYDYALRITNGIAATDPAWQERLAWLQFGSPQHQLHSCPLLNASYCPATESAGGEFFATFYNPTSRTVWHAARLPVTGRYYRVLDEAGAPVASQTVPVHNGTLRIPERGGSAAVNELVFVASSVPPLGYVMYAVSTCDATDPGASVFTPILTVRDGGGGDEAEVQLGLGYYTGVRGNASGEAFRPSGAYVFRPTADRPEMFPKSSAIQGQVIGPVVNETHWNYNALAYLVSRRYRPAGPDYGEAEATVGPLPLYTNGFGLEVVAVYSDAGISGTHFLVDSNGRQLVPSVRDPARPEAAQFRPANAIVSLADAGRQLTVLPDRAVGASSRPAEGQLSLMVHRVTLDDDGFGVGEALRERGSDGRGLVVRAAHWYFASEPALAADRYRPLASQRHRAPLVAFTLGLRSPGGPGARRWSALAAPLPDSAQILTLEPWRQPDWLLLRLEHLYQANESAVHSAPVSVDIGATFSAFDVLEAVELNLSANQRLADQRRLRWRTRSDRGRAAGRRTGRRHIAPPFSVTLRPMEIRTFEIRVSHRANAGRGE